MLEWSEAAMRDAGLPYVRVVPSATFWSFVFERLMGGVLDKKNPAGTLAAAAATSALAAFTDLWRVAWLQYSSFPISTDTGNRIG